MNDTKLPPSMRHAFEELSGKLQQQISDELTRLTREVGDQTDRKLNSFVKRIDQRRQSPPEESHKEESAALNDQAVQLFYRNELGQATQFLENAVKLDPESLEAWNNLAMVYTAQNQTERATRAFEEAVALDPKRADIINNKGVLALLDASPEQALSLFEEANQEAQPQIPVLLNLAQAHLALGHYERAIQAWKLVIAIDPEQEEAKQNLRQYYQ